MNRQLALLHKKRNAIHTKWKQASHTLNMQIALLEYGIEVGCTLISEDGEKLLVTNIDRRYHLEMEHMCIDGLITKPKRIYVSDIEAGYWKKFEPDADEEDDDDDDEEDEGELE